MVQERKSATKKGLQTEKFDWIVLTLLALANDKRRRILEAMRLHDRPIASKELAESVSISPAEVHNHMAIMRDARYVRQLTSLESAELSNEGLRTYYELTREAKATFKQLENRTYASDLTGIVQGFSRVTSLLGIPTWDIDRANKKGLGIRLAILYEILKRGGATPSELLRSSGVRRWAKDPAILSYHLSKMERILQCNLDTQDKRRRRYLVRIDDDDVYASVMLLAALGLPASHVARSQS